MKRFTSYIRRWWNKQNIIDKILYPTAWTLGIVLGVLAAVSVFSNPRAIASDYDPMKYKSDLVQGDMTLLYETADIIHKQADGTRKVTFNSNVSEFWSYVVIYDSELNSIPGTEEHIDNTVPIWGRIVVPIFVILLGFAISFAILSILITSILMLYHYKVRKIPRLMKEISEVFD